MLNVSLLLFWQIGLSDLIDYDGYNFMIFHKTDARVKSDVISANVVPDLLERPW